MLLLVAARLLTLVPLIITVRAALAVALRSEHAGQQSGKLAR